MAASDTDPVELRRRIAHLYRRPVFVAGPRVKGFYGDEPSLTDLDSGDLRFTTDFRSIYSTCSVR